MAPVPMGFIITIAMIFVFGATTTLHIISNCLPFVAFMWACDQLGSPFPRMLPSEHARLLGPLVLHVEEQKLSLIEKRIIWVDPNAGTAKEVPNAQAKLISELEQQERKLRVALRACYRSMGGHPWKFVSFVMWCKWLSIAGMESRAWGRYYTVESQLEETRCPLSDDDAAQIIRELKQCRAARVSEKE